MKKSNNAIRQDKNGKWLIDTKIKIDGEFKHFKRNGYDSYTAASADFERAKQEFISSKSLNKSNIKTFDELLDEYIKMRKIVVGVTTIESDKGVYNVHILPYFKGKTIKETFTLERIKEWYNALINTTEYTNSRKSKVITRMKDLLNFAYKHKYIDAQTFQDCDVCIYQVKYSKKPATERVVWTKEEESAFWNAVSVNPKDELMFKVFFSCSPRLGEFLGLQTNCFVYKDKKIIIKQQAYYIGGKGVVLSSKLKTQDSYRTIIVSDAIADELENYIKTLCLKENDYLFFGHQHNVPFSRTAFRKKLKRYCDIAGVREINPHAVRHQQAVKLARVADSAEFIEAAARRLGHSPEMFLNTYARHANDKTEKELLERINQV